MTSQIVLSMMKKIEVIKRIKKFLMTLNLMAVMQIVFVVNDVSVDNAVKWY